MAVHQHDEVTPARGLVTLAEHARLCGVSRKSATIWKQAGKLKMVGALVDHAASYRGERYATSSKAARQDPPPPQVLKRQVKPAAVPPAAQAEGQGPGPADAPEVTSNARARLNDAVTRKEEYTGRLKELEFLQRSGELVRLDVARKVFFDEARAARDLLQTWPARSSALIAADLGIDDAGRVAAVLQAHVHRLLVALSEPRPEGFDDAMHRSGAGATKH